MDAKPGDELREQMTGKPMRERDFAWEIDRCPYCGMPLGYTHIGLSWYCCHCGHRIAEGRTYLRVE